MVQEKYSDIIKEQTNRALWEVENVIACIPDAMWEKEYCGMPLWKHVYHMLHSLDLWFINPDDPGYVKPWFHDKDLNNLDVVTNKLLSRETLEAYFLEIEKKIKNYTENLEDDMLLLKPEGCKYTRFTLILAQHRHLHTHMGMIMGVITAETGLWPRVLGLEGKFPDGEYEKYF